MVFLTYANDFAHVAHVAASFCLSFCLDANLLILASSETRGYLISNDSITNFIKNNFLKAPLQWQRRFRCDFKCYFVLSIDVN